MLTWLILGYLMASMVTFLFVYSAYIIAAHADEIQEQNMATYAIVRRSTKHVYTPTENFSLSTL